MQLLKNIAPDLLKHLKIENTQLVLLYSFDCKGTRVSTLDCIYTLNNENFLFSMYHLYSNYLLNILFNFTLYLLLYFNQIHNDNSNRTINLYDLFKCSNNLNFFFDFIYFSFIRSFSFAQWNIGKQHRL